MKKRLFQFFVIVLLAISLCSCYSKNSPASDSDTKTNTETETAFETYEEIDGKKHEIGYLLSLNNLKKQDYVGKSITLVGELTSIDGPSIMGNIEFQSKIQLKTPSGWLYVNTSGQENLVKEWETGDIIMVKGRINLLDSSRLFILEGQEGGDVGLTKIK